MIQKTLLTTKKTGMGTSFEAVDTDGDTYLSIYLTFFNLPRPTATAATAATATA